MGFSISIDTGGTFTDGLFARGPELQTVKVLTTPHDPTVCLMNCIEEGAAAYGLSEEDLLRDTDIIRYSTTIATNTIIQRAGSKLGLIVTAGREGDVGPIHSLIPAEMIAGVDPLSREDVLARVQEIIDRGATAMVVSLSGSYQDPSQEQQVKTWIKEEFPRYYLGSPTVFLASEVSNRPGELLRTCTAVLNAYIHRSMVRYLYKAEEDLRQKLLARPLLVVHNSGGVARVAKTKALDTYNSGPMAGLVGVDNLRQKYGFKNVISTDMGGTSLDIGVISQGRFGMEMEPVVAGLKINQSMVDIRAIGAGGGSIARVAEGRVQVGPESAGSLPGPACFNLGGTKPTVTDADLVLGFIDQDYFLGGRIKLDPERSVEAIRSAIADPLGISVDAAALRIRQVVDEYIAGQIRDMIAGCGDGWNPEAVFAYGGAGPTHCCGYLAGLPQARIITSPYSAVFSAFGLGNMDVIHKYALGREISLTDGSYEATAAAVDGLLGKLRQAAYRDMRSEGFQPDEISFYLEVFGRLLGNSEEERVLVEAPALSAGLLAEMGHQYTALSSIVLNAAASMAHQDIPVKKIGGSDSLGAKVSQRLILWPGKAARQATAVYRRELLGAGNVVLGPAVIEAADTTCVVPGGYRYTVDEYLNGIIERVD